MSTLYLIKTACPDYQNRDVSFQLAAINSSGDTNSFGDTILISSALQPTASSPSPAMAVSQSLPATPALGRSVAAVHAPS